MRRRAIWCALSFGIRPSWMYETTPHYECGYWRHLAMNLALAARWATWRETDEDREFEITVNGARPYSAVIHTIPVPTDWSAEQAWEAIRRKQPLPTGRGCSWANVLTDDRDHFIRMLPSDLSELSE